jgi:hypothetical protein
VLGYPSVQPLDVIGHCRKRAAHLLLQVRAAALNGDLRERLTYKPPKQAHRSRIAWLFEPTPPLLKTA